MLTKVCTVKQGQDELGFEAGLDAFSGFGHEFSQTGKAVLGDDSIGGKLLLGHIASGGSLHFTAGDLYVKGLLDLEDDVQKRQRIGAQVIHEVGARLNCVDVHAQRVGDACANDIDTSLDVGGSDPFGVGISLGVAARCVTVACHITCRTY